MSNAAKLIDSMIAKTPDWRGATLAKLRKIIQDADPEMTEDVKWCRPSNPMGAPVRGGHRPTAARNTAARWTTAAESNRASASAAWPHSPRKPTTSETILELLGLTALRAMAPGARLHCRPCILHTKSPSPWQIR
jgi:hypothetical protein